MVEMASTIPNQTLFSLVQSYACRLINLILVLVRSSLRNLRDTERERQLLFPERGGGYLHISITHDIVCMSGPSVRSIRPWWSSSSDFLSYCCRPSSAQITLQAFRSRAPDNVRWAPVPAPAPRFVFRPASLPPNPTADVIWPGLGFPEEMKPT